MYHQQMLSYYMPIIHHVLLTDSVLHLTYQYHPNVIIVVKLITSNSIVSAARVTLLQRVC